MRAGSGNNQTVQLPQLLPLQFRLGLSQVEAAELLLSVQRDCLPFSAGCPEHIPVSEIHPFIRGG